MGASDLVGQIQESVVGRGSEIETMLAAVLTGRNLVLEGPPGTGKSTMLKAIGDVLDCDVIVVDGNAELTPGRLIGHFDPAVVLDRGYVDDAWIDGPLTRCARSGSVLYVEELNRVPAETLNLLVTAMSERRVLLPRLGPVPADVGFRVVAAMNPFDASGTHRISQAIADRVCRIALDYQDEADEIEIVGAHSHDSELIRRAVACVRASRDHADLAHGASVRGAIDLVVMADRLAELRGRPALECGSAAARSALSGRIRIHHGVGRTPEAIVDELWSATDMESGDSGKLDDSSADPLSPDATNQGRADSDDQDGPTGNPATPPSAGKALAPTRGPTPT